MSESGPAEGQRADLPAYPGRVMGVGSALSSALSVNLERFLNGQPVCRRPKGFHIGFRIDISGSAIRLWFYPSSGRTPALRIKV